MNGELVRLTLRDEVPPPHGGQPVWTTGAPERARGAMVMVHGRGATADDILELRREWRAEGLIFVAPQAAGYAWYPERFIAPLEWNEPHLSSALALIGAIADELTRRGLPPERQILLGFSQGGCLALEFAGRHARRWGGVVGLSAGLIGPPGHSWAFEGSLDGTPVFLGCDERDPHIPKQRVEETAAELRRIGGEVEMRIVQGLGHSVDREELERVQRIIDRLGASTSRVAGET